MRVLTVVNWLSRGGIEVMLYRCLPHLAARGVLLDMCCLGPPREMDGDFRDAGCRIFRIGKYANPYSTAGVLGRLLREACCSLVHSHMGYTSGGIALAGRRQCVPVVVSFHAPVPTALHDWDRRPFLGLAKRVWLRWHRHLMERHADVFVGHSIADIAGYDPSWRDRPDRCRIVVNGAAFPQMGMSRPEARRRLGIPLDAAVLLHVGSFRSEKNHAGLLRIASIVMDERRDAVLVMVGGGPPRDGVERLAAEMGLGEGVRFAGLQADVWPWYFAADVMVFPSEMEGFGIVLVESQAAGLPIVASDIPAHRESVAPDQRRFLFPLPDYKRAAELVLEQLDAAREGCNDWVRSSKAYAEERFTVERMAEELASLYRDLAGRRGSSA